MADWSAVLRPTPRRILEAMLGGASSLTEIAGSTRMGKSALVPHLKDLVAIGVLRSERVPVAGAVEARYHLRDCSLHLSIHASDRVAISWAADADWSPDAPLLAQIPQGEVRQEVQAFLDALSRADAMITQSCVVILFGSGARGEATWKSDVDVLVLVDGSRAREVVDQAAAAASIGTQHAIVPTVCAPEDFAARRKRILSEARREGMIVWAPKGVSAPWREMERYKAISI